MQSKTSQSIKEADPDHPVTTMLAGIDAPTECHCRASTLLGFPILPDLRRDRSATEILTRLATKGLIRSLSGDPRVTGKALKHVGADLLNPQARKRRETFPVGITRSFLPTVNFVWVPTYLWGQKGAHTHLVRDVLGGR